MLTRRDVKYSTNHPSVGPSSLDRREFLNAQAVVAYINTDSTVKNLRLRLSGRPIFHVTSILFKAKRIFKCFFSVKFISLPKYVIDSIDSPETVSIENCWLNPMNSVLELLT